MSRPIAARGGGAAGAEDWTGDGGQEDPFNRMRARLCATVWDVSSVNIRRYGGGGSNDE